VVAQEIELLEVLEAEAGPARRVDLDDPGDAERIRIRAGGFCRCRRRRESCGCSWRRGGLRGCETAPAKINPAAIRIAFSLC
jgi:hypothetical protein